jgi:hypothetical protein
MIIYYIYILVRKYLLNEFAIMWLLLVKLSFTFIIDMLLTLILLLVAVLIMLQVVVLFLELDIRLLK